MRRRSIVAVVAGCLLLAPVASCAGAHAVYGARAGRFEDACDATVGLTRAGRLAPFEDMRVTEVQTVGTDTPISVGYRYSPAGSADCDLEFRGGHVVSARSSRRNDFDLCTDPVSYPRRHWVCSVARLVVP